jgi:AraC family transcriptional regulator
MEQAIRFSKGKYVGHKIMEQSNGNILTSETIFSVGMTSDWHYHENPHFSHILYGGSTEFCELNAQQQHAGKSLYYYPGIPHQNNNYLPGTRIFNIEIDPVFFKIHDLEIPGESMMFHPDFYLSSGNLLKVLAEHQRADQDSVISIEQLTLELINTSPLPKTYYPEWTRKILTVLNDNWNTPVSLAWISKQVGLHPVSLSKHFTRYYKCTLGMYIRKIRVEHALHLIRQGNLSLTEIAYQCGFSDQAHFTRTFLSLTGMLPKTYRNI